MIRRTLLCSDCEFQWDERVDNSDVPVPECPACKAAAKRIPGMFAITGAKSKAIDAAQQMAEENFGMTDMRDNTRPGDVVAVGPAPMQTAEAEAITREMIQMGAAPELAPAMQEAAKNFWQHSGGLSQADANMAIQASAGAARAARAAGVDPIGMLHDAGKRGHMTVPLNVMGTAAAGD